MNRNQHKMIAAAAVIAAMGLADARAAVITAYNFNAPSTATLAPTTPTTGSGTLSFVGGTSEVATTPVPTGSPNDTSASAAQVNDGLGVTGFPAQSTNTGTAGVQIKTSTVGFTGIGLSFDLRDSGTASRFYQLQDTTNGTTYSNVSGGTATNPTTVGGDAGAVATISNAGLIQINSTGTQAFSYPFLYNFAAGSLDEQNANFGFRIVAVYDPSTISGTAAYTSSNTGLAADYKTSGNLRLDDVIISGTALSTPEPASLGLLGIGALGLLARRRRNA